MTVAPRNATKYAETVLGVHAAYEELESTIAQLEAERKLHVQLTGSVRSIRLMQEEHEQAVARKVREEEPDLATTAAFERKLKAALADDEYLNALKRDLVDRMNDAEVKEAEVTNLERRTKAKLARIEEISALLRFYAAHTEANTETSRRVFDPSRG